MPPRPIPLFIGDQNILTAMFSSLAASGQIWYFALFIGVVFVATASLRPRRPARPDRTPGKFKARDDLAAVTRSGFTAQAIVNQTEARWFTTIERAARQIDPDLRLMAQMALAGIVAPDAPRRGSGMSDALRAIVNKRVDMVLVDAAARPACVIEVNGRGHYGDHAPARDAVKKEALRKAGIPLLVIEDGDSEKAVIARLRDALARRRVAA